MEQDTTGTGAASDGPQTLLTTDQWRSIADRLQLSRRELDIVQCIFDGEGEAMIGRRLGISRHTVHSYVRRLYGKLAVADHAALVVRVFETYLTLEEEEAAPAAGSD